jgi:FOG: GGDEF domain
MADNALTRELVRIEAACNAGDIGGDTLCLLRVVQGLDPETWLRLKDELSLDLWMAAPPAQVAQDIGGIVRGVADAMLHDFLLNEMDRARHCQQPLALALIEPESDDARDAVFQLARAQLRRFDHASILGEEGPVAVVLSGTPLAAAERLLGAMLRRIRQVSDPGLVCSAGLVGYGGLVDLKSAALIERAQQALAEARRLGGNRLEVAPSADAVLASRETLVRASEKHFLFTGKKLPE